MLNHSDSKKNTGFTIDMQFVYEVHTQLNKVICIIPVSRRFEGNVEDEFVIHRQECSISLHSLQDS